MTKDDSHSLQGEWESATKRGAVVDVQGAEGKVPDLGCEGVQVNGTGWHEDETKQIMDWWGWGKGFRMDTTLWGAVRAGLDRGAGTY